MPVINIINKFMERGFVSPRAHGVLDYPLAAILIAGPLALDFDYKAATVIALVFGGAAVVLAVGTAWSTGIVKLIAPLLHAYADTVVTAALIVLPFAVGFQYRTPALVFYVVVGGATLLATLATRFPSGLPAAHGMMPATSYSCGPASVLGLRPTPFARAGRAAHESDRADQRADDDYPRSLVSDTRPSMHQRDR